MTPWILELKQAFVVELSYVQTCVGMGRYESGAVFLVFAKLTGRYGYKAIAQVKTLEHALKFDIMLKVIEVIVQWQSFRYPWRQCIQVDIWIRTGKVVARHNFQVGLFKKWDPQFAFVCGLRA